MPYQSPVHQNQADQDLDETQEVESSPAATLVKAASTFQEGEAILSPQAPSLLRSLFERMDANKDGGINRNEVKGHLKTIGVQGGLLGMVHTKVSKDFLKKLDTNKDSQVTWQEFVGVAQDVLPDSIFDESGTVKLDMLDTMFSGMDADTSGGVSIEEMHDYSLESLPEDTAHKSIVADIAARFGVDAMDTDGSGSISREEIDRAAQEISLIKQTEVDV